MSFPQCKKKSESELKGLETLILYTKGPFTFFAKKTACFQKQLVFTCGSQQFLRQVRVRLPFLLKKTACSRNLER